MRMTTLLDTDYSIETELLNDEIDLMIDLIEDNCGSMDSSRWNIAQSILHKLIQPLRLTSLETDPSEATGWN